VIEKQTNIASLTWLRGIASLLVCLFHFKDYVWQKETPNFLIKFISHGHLGVIMFFVISGFVIPYSMYIKNYELKNFFKFLLKRTLRIEPPFVVFVLIILAFQYYTCVKMWGIPYPYTVKQFILNITYLAPFFKMEWINIAFWTLAVEFQFYILTGLSYNLFISNKNIKYVGFIALLSTGFIVPKEYQTVLHNYIYFIIGFQTFMYYTKQIKGLEFVLTLIASTVFIVVFKEIENLPFIAVTVLGILYFKYEHKIAVFFGDISYSLYLTHGLIGGTIVLFTKSDMPKFMLFFYILFNAICFAYFYYYTVERSFLKLSKKIKY
jgi:peptidoglycan/LPS O-acetylase OafA/YrhL